MTIRDGVNQLLGKSPNKELEKKTLKQINLTLEKHNLRTSQIKTMKIGRLFYILVYVLIESSFENQTVKKFEKIREHTKNSIRGVHPELIIDMVFTENQKWFN